MAITAEQLTEYFTSQGVTLDPLVADAITELVNNPNLTECMVANGYSPAFQTILALYLGYLLAIGNFSRFITSQTAPNGASRSFSQATLGDMWRGTLAALRPFDPAGCLDEFLPADPTVTKKYFSRVGVACYGK